MQQLVDAPLVLIGAGLPQTPERLMTAGSFAERFQYQQLDPLTPPEAAAALMVPAQHAGVFWDQPAADLVLNQSQGSPYLVQRYGDAAWRHANPATDGTTAIADIATALGKPQNRISYLRSRLLDKGLITSPYRGRLSFTMTGFDQFITTQST